LIQSGSALTGMTYAGGASNLGVVFTFPVPPTVPALNVLGLIVFYLLLLTVSFRFLKRRRTAG
jgi:hypothetical protein